jgi:hypothetical protein
MSVIEINDKIIPETDGLLCEIWVSFFSVYEDYCVGVSDVMPCRL